MCVMSSNETVNTRNTVTGKLQRLTHDQIRPFAKVLEVVADDAKPYEPGLFKPGKTGESKDSSAATKPTEGTPTKGAEPSGSSTPKGDRK